MLLLFKSTLFKIKKSMGRFLSVVLIVALGTGFFAGLREASPDMLHTVDKYYDNSVLMDYKITSTMGLTDDDINSLKELKNVSKVVPSYSLDVLSNGEAIRLHAIENDVNKVILKEGRLPKNENECLGDASYFKLGQSPTFEKENLNDFIKISSCKIVGLIDSSLYLSTEKGIASIGNGKLESFIFMPKENFVMDYYTESYLIAKGTIETITYSKKYDKAIKKLDDELQVLKPLQETKRYEELLDEGMANIYKAEAQLNDESSKAQEELDKTKSTLEENEKKLNKGFDTLKNEINNFNREKNKTENEINSGKEEIENGRDQLNSSLNQFGITIDTLSDTLNSLKVSLDACTENCAELQNKYQSLKAIESSYNTLNTNETKLLEEEKTFKAETSKASKKLNNEQKRLNDNKTELENGWSSYRAGLDKIEKSTTEAQTKIDEQKKQLDKLEKPVWYLLDRTANNGYTGFYEDASKVASIAKVFPIFFILVAGLMCLNTMTRLIEEERTEIGIFTSLGYSNFKIISGYIFYCLIATFIGVAIGLSVGYYLIPSVIYGIYNSNYVLPDLIINAKPIPFLLMVVYAGILMSAVAIYVCMHELKDKPAILLRPKSPKNGKKVLLEKINFIWKRFSFTWKVTIRNIFRYKKRVFMTLIGIAGCTALLLTGFGLRDGINGIGKLQYNKILKYDALVALNEEVTTLPNDLKTTLKDNGLTSPLLINQEAYTFNAKNKNHDVYIISPESDKTFEKYVYLNNGNEISLPKYGAVITSKMAELLKVKTGDTIKVRDNQNNLYVIYVADVTENYLMHYIYMSHDYFKKTMNNDGNYNMIMAQMKNNNYDEIATNLLNNDKITVINYTKDNIESYDTIIKGMNKIVYLIIGAALLLALIVLYNLVIINMNERKREIATLKVLGFKNKEISSYVYRETIILMIIGIIIGLFLGVILHQYVIITAETDSIVFLRNINWLSYVFAILITVIASIIIQLVTYRYLLKIDMIESLKALDQ